MIFIPFIIYSIFMYNKISRESGCGFLARFIGRKTDNYKNLCIELLLYLFSHCEILIVDV